MKRLLRLSPHGLALALAYALKRFYSAADAGDLDLALVPTTWLVTRLTGARFYFEEGFGHVAPALGLAVVPGCAGLNFMVIVFLALIFGFMHRWARTADRVLFLVASALFAYVSTLIVNAARIVSAQRIFVMLEGAWSVGFDEVHRVVGVVLYVTALFVMVAAIERLPIVRGAAR
jgi:exosortase K